jgi:hypothetical protein
VRIAEEGFQAECFSQTVVFGELGSVVEGQAPAEALWQRP